MNAILNKFFELAVESERVDSEELDAPVEPSFEAVLAHVLAHPQARSEFADAFVRIAREPALGSPELIQFCMHALRWDEVRESFVRWLMREQSERVRHVLRKILESFGDDWRDAGMYVRYGGDPLL